MRLGKKVLYMLALLLHCFTSLAAESFPTYLKEPIDSNWYTYNQLYFSLDPNNRLIRNSIDPNSLEITSIVIASLPYTPDLIRHYPLRNGDMVMAVYNERKKLLMLTFDFDGRLSFKNDYSFPRNVIDIDARIGRDGRPSALLLTYNNGNYELNNWENGQYENIFLSSESIKSFFLHSSKNKIHILSKRGASFKWVIKSKDNIYSLRLNEYLTKARFFSWKSSIYLMALSARGTLLLYSIENNLLIKKKLFTDQRLVNSDSIIPLVLDKKFYFLFPAPNLSSAFRLEVYNLENGHCAKKLEERKMLSKGKMHPLILNDHDLYFLKNSGTGHTNLESWEKTIPYIYNFRFSVRDLTPPAIDIQWSSKGRYTYKHLFNEVPDMLPLGEGAQIPKNKLTLYDFTDGKYIFHFNANTKGTQGQFYHIPVKYKYLPPEPEIEILNEITKDLVPRGKLDFVIKNYYPATYYAQINNFPIFEPVNPIVPDGARFSMPANLEKGRYYLHIRVRDPGSGIFSRTLHKVFYIDTRITESDPELEKAGKMQYEAEYLLQKVKENEYNIEEQKKWLEKLRKLYKEKIEE